MDVRELMLDRAQMAGEAPAPPLPEGLSDPAIVWPEYEVVYRDGPDAVVVHRDDETDELLVMLMSRGQFYMRSADSDVVRPMTPKGLSAFLRDVGVGGVDAVPWCSRLTSDPRDAAGFCSLVTSSDFSALAKRSMVWCEYGARADALADSAVRRCLAGGQKAVVRAAWDAARDMVGEEASRVALGIACGLRKPWTSDGEVAVDSHVRGDVLSSFRDLFSSLDRTAALRGRLGLDVLRDYMAAWATLPDRAPWSQEMDGLVDVIDLAEREGFDFKPSSLVEYATGGSRRAALDAVTRMRWMGDWRDVLMMQVATDGRVFDKYPEDLPVLREELMARLHRRLSATSGDDREKARLYAERVEQLAPNEWVSGDYFIEVPTSTEDIVEEARRQHNCLAGYADAYLRGGTDLYFMRRCDLPDDSLVTVEVRNAEVRQAYGARNRDLEPLEARWLSAWCGRCGFELPQRFTPMFVGEAPAAQNANHGQLVGGRGR